MHEHLRKRRASTRFWTSPRGHIHYTVTESQFDTLDILVRLMRAQDYELKGFFCSQSVDGTIVLGVNHTSVGVNRRGKLIRNSTTGMKP